MKLRMLWAIAIAVSVGTSMGADASADPITATSSDSYAEAYDGSTDDSETKSDPPIDLITSASAGGASSRTETTVTSTSIDFDADWTTEDAYFSYGISEAIVEFTADGSWAFELSGSAAEFGGEGMAGMILSLKDLTNDEFLFYSDSSTDVSGVTGVIRNNNSYELYYYGFILNDDPNGPWTNLEGGGGALFELGRAVPEPGTLALLGLGFGGLVFLRRRRVTA